MLRGNEVYWKVNRAKNLPDSVVVNKIKYIIRFSAKYAQHIVDNAGDPQHNINFAEIVELIKNSIILPIQPKANKRVALGRHRGKLYETYFTHEQGRIDVVTSFSSGKHDYIFLFQAYENNEI
jgi:hypothetical protein